MNLSTNSCENTGKSCQDVLKRASVFLSKDISCQSKQHSPEMSDAILEVISYT